MVRAVPYRDLVHLAERMDLPTPYVARPYRGPADHPEMARVLNAHRARVRDAERVDAAMLDVTYARLQRSDPHLDVALIEDGTGALAAYARTEHEDLATGTRDCIVFSPITPEHAHAPLFHAIVRAEHAHLAHLATEAADARYRAWAWHPGPDQPAVDDAAWLEELGYTAQQWGATLVRPHLDEIPERPLPDGVEVRPVTEDQVRTIIEAHHEAFRGEWDFSEATENDIMSMIEDPRRDISLWQVAWAGNTVVGQVKPFIDRAENDEHGRSRAYTEFISTHRDWRNRGIAGALLARALRAVRDHGMTEAALGVDTNNPGGAFHLYTSLGFVLQSYEAVYFRPAP